MSEHPRKDMIALSIQQPWAELILGGLKLLEVRSYHCRSTGTVYVYASRRDSSLPCAQVAMETYDLDAEKLVKGMILGTVEITSSRPARAEDAWASCVTEDLLESNYCWTLENPVRFEKPLAVKYQPYGVWFYPFQRKK